MKWTFFINILKLLHIDYRLFSLCLLFSIVVYFIVFYLFIFSSTRISEGLCVQVLPNLPETFRINIAVNALQSGVMANQILGLVSWFDALKQNCDGISSCESLKDICNL